LDTREWRNKDQKSLILPSKTPSPMSRIFYHSPPTSFRKSFAVTHMLKNRRHPFCRNHIFVLYELHRKPRSLTSFSISTFHTRLLTGENFCYMSKKEEVKNEKIARIIHNTNTRMYRSFSVASIRRIPIQLVQQVHQRMWNVPEKRLQQSPRSWELMSIGGS